MNKTNEKLEAFTRHPSERTASELVRFINRHPQAWFHMAVDQEAQVRNAVRLATNN